MVKDHVFDNKICHAYRSNVVEYYKMDDIREVEPFLATPRELNAVSRNVTLSYARMNKEYVVLFYENVSHTNIYHIVGKLNGTGNEEESSEQEPLLSHHGIDWGLEQDYGAGCNVQIALNDNGVVVLVRSRTITRKCAYSVGKVTEAKTIEWFQRDEHLCSGVNPTVAMMGDTVLFLHEADYGLNRSYYNVGKVGQNSKMWITGRRDARVEALDGCKESSITIMNDGIVVISCRNKVGSNLHYAVGKLDDVLLDSVEFKGRYSSGYYSRINVLSNGMPYGVRNSSSSKRIWTEVQMWELAAE